MMKGQKGITLVALIITIIVMLILVGVSISVALNGGLFTKADDASRQTKQAQIAEAAALAKAELLSQFYAATTDAARIQPEAGAVADLVETYLDASFKDKVTVEEADQKYTVTAEGIDYKGTEAKPVIDLSGLKYAE